MCSLTPYVKRFWLKLDEFYILVQHTLNFGAKTFQGWLESRFKLFWKALS